MERIGQTCDSRCVGANGSSSLPASVPILVSCLGTDTLAVAVEALSRNLWWVELSALVSHPSVSSSSSYSVGSQRASPSSSGGTNSDSDSSRCKLCCVVCFCVCSSVWVDGRSAEPGARRWRGALREGTVGGGGISEAPLVLAADCVALAARVVRLDDGAGVLVLVGGSPMVMRVNSQMMPGTP